jgi:hypothetical protein
MKNAQNAKILKITPTGKNHHACGPIYKIVVGGREEEEITLDELFNMLPADSEITYPQLMENAEILIGIDLVD